MRRLVGVYVTGRRDRREISAKTYENYLIVLRSFCLSYGERDPKRLGRTDIERWLATKAHLSAGSRQNLHVIMRAFCKWLQLRQVIRHDPMLGLRAPRLPRRVPRALLPDETAAIEGVLPDLRALAAYALMRRMGLRRAEAVSVAIEGWDHQHQLMFVRGKGGHERFVPVPDAAATILAAYIVSTGASSGPILRRLDGHGPITSGHLGVLMKQWMTDAGVKRNPFDGKGCHSLRHTLASNVADAETDLRVLQQILGHTHLNTTQVYLRPAEVAKMRAAMETVA